jgi:hypothetical protein
MQEYPAKRSRIATDTSESPAPAGLSFLIACANPDFGVYSPAPPPATGQQWEEGIVEGRVWAKLNLDGRGTFLQSGSGQSGAAARGDGAAWYALESVRSTQHTWEGPHGNQGDYDGIMGGAPVGRPYSSVREGRPGKPSRQDDHRIQFRKEI